MFIKGGGTMGMEIPSIFDVAEWFLSKSSMTPKKLQKLVYYAYSWTLTLVNEDEESLEFRLFEDSIPEAWVHGPVFPELYKEYKDYGWQQIPKYEDEVYYFEEDVEDILEQVFDVYGSLTGNQLETITHQEEPWLNAREGCGFYQICTNEISDIDIYRCYAARL